MSQRRKGRRAAAVVLQWSHSLSISVMPLSSDRVLLKQGGDPLFTLGFPLTGRLPLSFLEDELLIGGLRLVLVVDGAGHVLPQSEGHREDELSEFSLDSDRMQTMQKIDMYTSLTRTLPAPLGARCSGSADSVSDPVSGSRKCPLSLSSCH